MVKEGLIKGEDHTGITVVYLCHDGQGNVVMGKRNKNARDEHGKWDIGSGAIEFDGLVENTIIREIAEEYCTKVLAYEFLGYRDIHRLYEGRRTHWIALDFKVLIDPSLVKNGEPHKFDEVGLFRLDLLPSPVHSQFSLFLEKYRNKLINP